MHLSITKGLVRMQMCGLLFVLFYGRINVCEARKHLKLPLIEERLPKARTRPLDCPFGNQSFEIEERWRPDLQPFGVYYCIRCECVAVQRKNRIVAKVRCKNIKNDCPKPTCEDPVLLPERCCKTCPGEDYAELEEDLAVRKLESQDDDLIKDYSVQLDGRGLNPKVQTDISARGYLSFQKRHLHYTLYINISGTQRPTYVRFTDEEGNILEEHEIESFTQSANISKVSGIWRNVPKVYRAMLRKGKLHLAIAIEKGSDASSVIAGKVTKNDLSHPGVFTELLNLKQTAEGIGVTAVTAMPVTAQENNSQIEKKYINDEDSQNNLIGEPSHKCYYELEIYEDGAQWKAQHDDCEMCFCHRGRVQCEQELCPKLSCSNQTRVLGSCCPICANQVNLMNTSVSSTKGCYFEGDKKFHMAGTRWHPYLPPFGFDKCSHCACLAESLEIKCERNTNCPALTCPEQEAYRENPMDCCKRCPNAIPVKAIVSVDQLGDQRFSGGLHKSPNELMAAGGCKFRGRIYTNGDEWHPTVQPFGEVKCVKCHCKNGIPKCKRIICPTITACSIVINKDNECCPVCADDSYDMMQKNQPIIGHKRKRGKNPRRNKGRRALREHLYKNMN